MSNDKTLSERVAEVLAIADNYRNTGSQQLVDDMARIIREQQAEIESARKDAERWRYTINQMRKGYGTAYAAGYASEIDIAITKESAR